MSFRDDFRQVVDRAGVRTEYRFQNELTDDILDAAYAELVAKHPWVENADRGVLVDDPDRGVPCFVIPLGDAS